MRVTYAIVHELKKEVNTTPQLSIRETVLPLSASLNRLFEDLMDAYTRRSTKGLGSFNSDENTYPFSKDLTAYLSDNVQANFIDFSMKAMGHIKSRIATSNLATGGYVLFFVYSDEEISEHPHIFISLLRQTTGCVVTQSLEISDAEHLDIDNLHIGCHINTYDWKHGSSSPYITFIKGSSSRTTPEYFLQAIGCAEFTDSTKQTKEFVRALNDYALEQKFTHDEKNTMNCRAHDYCKEFGIIDLKTLSALVSPHDEPDKFLGFVNKGDYKISNGFEPDKRVLKSLREISAKGEGISLRFPAGMLGERISYTDSDGDSKIIIKNPPESMIKAFREEE